MNQWSRFLPFVRPQILMMACAGVAVMGVAACNLILIRLAGSLWDLITVQQDLQQLTSIVWMFLGLVVGQGVLSMVHSYLTALASQHVMADFRTHVFSHLHRLSLNFFAKRRTGELISRLMNDVGVIQSLLTETPMDALKHLVTIIGGVGFLLVMNWRLCVLILILLPLLAIVARIFGKRLKALSMKIQDQTAHVTILIEEVVSGIREVKSFVQGQREEARFRLGVEGLLATTMQRTAVLAVFVPVITFFTFVMAIGVLWYGGKQVIEGQLSPGELFAFVLFAGILIGPFGSAARIFSQVKEVQGAMTRVFELLDTPLDIQDSPNAQPLVSIRGDVQFEEVQFAYEKRPPVLEGVSFSIKAGECVALVGPTGAGKTTIINLLHRFYDPTKGRVLIDGHDVKSIQLDSLYHQLALVPQETFLFGGTIMDNVRYGRWEAAEADVLEASQRANAHEFIQALPEGYETVLGEKGVNLSGGQRQRVAIARALLKDPRILILDEATSALDSHSESLVQGALIELMKGRTTLMIAHRFSSIQRADRILVLHRGRIIEEGGHEALLEKRGLYHHLYTLREVEGVTDVSQS
ncbi:MAG: ABC transporter ATP-binding protein [Nitrospirota bacterium]|nr:ABC transporter ATP-binding protein [Nitrospirota bacterium]MDX2419455.1 ABC transporter ATP-binding protein [Nitrospirota bacterium]